MQWKFKAKVYWYFYYVVSFDDKHVCHERAYGHVSNYKKVSTEKFFNAQFQSYLIKAWCWYCLLLKIWSIRRRFFQTEVLILDSVVLGNASRLKDSLKATKYFGSMVDWKDSIVTSLEKFNAGKEARLKGEEARNDVSN